MAGTGRGDGGGGSCPVWASVCGEATKRGSPGWGCLFSLMPNPEGFFGGLREVVAEAGPEHVVDALGADAAGA